MGVVRAWLVLIMLAVLVLAALAVPTVVWLGRRFDHAVDLREATVRDHDAPDSCRTDLPPLLAAYAARIGMAHPERTRWTRIEQRAEMRLSEGGKWLSLTAVQHSAAITPGFMWRATVRLAPGVPAVVVDGLSEGRGFLEARLFGALPLAKSDDEDTLKGELLRYVAELPWNPAALMCGQGIAWRQVDARRVAAEIEYFGASARVVFSFDDTGDIVEATAADRPRGVGRGSVPTPWGGAFGDYREVGGLRIPAQAVVWWNLPSGRFEYWRGEVTRVTWEQGEAIAE